MAYTTLTLDEMIDFCRSETRNRIPGADMSVGGYYDLRARLLAAMFFGGQAQGQFLSRQILPDQAGGEYLARHRDIRRMTVLRARGSVGKVLLRATSAGTFVQAINSVLTHADGTTYELTAPCTVYNAAFTGKSTVTGSTRERLLITPDTTTMVAGDVFTVNGETVAIREVLATASAIDVYPPLDVVPPAASALTTTNGGGVAVVRALVTGAITNKPVFDLLTLSAPTTGISGTTPRVVEMSGGGDDEMTEELRARIMAFIAIPPGSGNVEDWRTWARTIDTLRVADAFVFANQRGLGTVDVYPIGVSNARAPSAGMIAAVQAALAEKGPVYVDALVKSFTYTADQAVTLQIVPGPDYQSDFGFTTYVLAGASSTTRINLVASPVGSVEIGDRIAVPVQIAGRWETYERTVLGVTASYVDLTVALPGAPVAGSVATSGGPLWQSAYDAIASLFDLLGPGAVSAGVGYQRHPSPSVEWSDTLYVAEIVSAIMAIPGVANVVVTTPALDITPSLGQIIRRGVVTIISG